MQVQTGNLEFHYLKTAVEKFFYFSTAVSLAFHQTEACPTHGLFQLFQ